MTQMARTGNCLDSQDISPAVPNANDSLVFKVPGGWTPTPAGAGPDGAIGLAITYMPTPAPTPDTNNCFHTEATFRAALAATLLVTCGPITAAVDSSLATANLTASALPGAGRVTLTSAHGNIIGANDVLNVLDGASLQDFAEINGSLTVNFTCATAPGLTYTRAFPATVLRQGRINNNGAAALVTLTAGKFLEAYALDGGTWSQNAAGALFALTGAGAEIITYNDSPSGFIGAGIITGAAGMTWLEDIGANSNLTAAPGFTGTHNIVYLGNARDIEFLNPVIQPAQTGKVTIQYAEQMKLGLVWNIAGPYTIDTGTGPPGQCDSVIRCGAANLTITLPSAALNPGRELTFIDVSGGAGGNAFVIQPLPADSIGPLGAGVARNVTQIEAKAVTIKSVAATGALQWDIISSTTLV